MTQTALATGPRLDEDKTIAQLRERRRFRTAMALSALAHGLVLALLVFLWQPIVEESPPPAAIPVTVVKEQEGQSGAAGGGSSETAASSPNSEAAAANAAPSASNADEPLRQTEAPPKTPPQPSSEVPSLAQNTVTPAPAQQETLEPVPQRKPTPPRPKPPPSRTETAQATPAPMPQPTTTEPATAGQAPSQTASAAGSDQPLPPGVGGRGRGEEGTGRAAVGNGSPNGLSDDYLDAVRRWVARYRKYPEEAVKQKQEGIVQLGFKFTRDGTVLDAWIEKSSGFPMLDQAALQMIRAASPIPKVPPQYQGDTLTLVMPENFRIGLFDRLFH